MRTPRACWSFAGALLLAAATALSGCGRSAADLCECTAGAGCRGPECPAAPADCVLPPPSRSAAREGTVVHAFGPRRVGTELTFEVPPGAAGLHIVEQLVSAPPRTAFEQTGSILNSAGPLRVVDPSGRVVWDLFRAVADRSVRPLLSGSMLPGTGSMGLPVTSEGLSLAGPGLPAGRWSLVVSDLAHACSIASDCAEGGASDDSVYDVTVIVRSAPGGGIPPSGRLDLALNLTPSGLEPALSARTAATDPDLARMLATLGALLSRANVSLGETTFVDVPPRMADRVAAGLHGDDNGLCGEMQQLLATAPAGRQVNVFLVPGFVSAFSAPGTRLAGLDGTVPGPATVSPTYQSGVAASAADLRAGREYCVGPGPAAGCGADALAFVVAHEIGHFLGLYHVTGRSGTAFDPLADTAQCACASCAPDPSLCADASPKPAISQSMFGSLCRQEPACGGGDNLMFWLYDGASRGALSDEQQRVLRANPAVY